MAFDEATGDSPAWAARTAPEIRSIGEEDGSVAVVPVGSIEQHGNHLPVSTDTILADAAAHLGAECVAEEVPILVTPPIWTGLSPHHMDFGGTITLSVETLLSMLGDIADSIRDNGFDAVLFLNGHGGNMSVIGTAVTEIGQRFPDAQVLGLTYFQLAGSFIDEIRESDLGGMAHGGEFETSMMLYLRPDLVDLDRAEARYLDDPYDLRRKDLFEGGPLSVYRSFAEYSETGAIGDPGLATAEKGEEIYERLGDELESLLLAMYEHNR
ncbi:creatininase family protein [Natrinema gelatinilyticum]|uniref:creatininase family protein n=1 Tax=Natrinema gelatinilyticum TaxID=2961571 RepID=UPI0020C24C40|nr:creatininase family protein [Natrinema gelatinilyticum]